MIPLLRLTTSKSVSNTVSYSRNRFAHGIPAVGGGATAVAHISQGFNSPAALTGTREEVQEKKCVHICDTPAFW